MIDQETQRKIDDHVREIAIRLLTAQVPGECPDDLDIPVKYHHSIAADAFDAGEEKFWDWYSQCGGPTNEEGIQSVLDQVGSGIDLYSAAEELCNDGIEDCDHTPLHPYCGCDTCSDRRAI